MPGLVFACGPKREMLVALRTNPTALPDQERIAWKTTQYVPDVCTPLLYQGKLFVLDGDRQTMTCYQPATGEKVWQGKLGVREIFYASPTGADGKIYCYSEEGTAVVLSAGDQFEVLGTVSMGEGPSNSSIVAANGALFIRTGKSLYCIQGKK
jgi:outer membrane protein assembly factor BamB